VEIFRFTGVTWKREPKKWEAYVHDSYVKPDQKKGFKKRILGYFANEEDAARAADKGRIQNVRWHDQPDITSSIVAIRVLSVYPCIAQSHIRLCLLVTLLWFTCTNSQLINQGPCPLQCFVWGVWQGQKAVNSEEAMYNINSWSSWSNDVVDSFLYTHKAWPKVGR